MRLGELGADAVGAGDHRLVAAADGGRQLLGAEHRQYGQRDAAADALHAGQLPECFALSGRTESEQGPAVLADLQLGEDGDVPANRAERIERPRAGLHLVTDAMDVDDGAVGAGFGQDSMEAGDHRATLTQFSVIASAAKQSSRGSVLLRRFAPRNDDQFHPAFSRPVGQGRMTRLIRLFMVGILLFFAAARPAMAQSILRDSETELLFREMSEPLIEAAGLDPKSVRVVLVNDPEINAFVAGSQDIYVFSGLIEAADSAEEVQGVLAHELGHVMGGHAIRVNEGAKTATGISLLSLLLA